MARISTRTLKSGVFSYTAEIRLKGYPSTSKTFRKKSNANNWARLTEAQMLQGRYNATLLAGQKKLYDAITRFKNSIENKSYWQKLRQNESILSFWSKEIGQLKLSYIKASLIVEMRDKLMVQNIYRKKLRSPSTCNRVPVRLKR